MLKKYLFILSIISNVFLIKIKRNDKWEIIKTGKEYYKKKNEKIISVIIFTNFQEKENVDLFEKKIKKLQEKKIIQEKNIGLYIIDYHKDDFFKDHFDLENGNYLNLFIHNKKFDLFEFDEIFHSDEILVKINEFIEERVNSVIPVLETMSDFERVLGDKKIVGVYLGEKNNDFNNIYNLALEFFLEFDFFFSEERKLKKKIFERYNKKIQKKNLFVIIRHKSLLTNFDSEPLIFFSSFEKKKLKDFLIYEKSSKLQNCKKTSYMHDLIHLNKKIIFYYEKNPLEKKKEKIFEKFLLQMPKKFIFTKCKKNDLFSKNSFLAPTKNDLKKSLQIVYYQNGKIHYKYMNRDFNVENINSFVFNFYVNNRNLFDVGIKEFDLKYDFNKEL